MRQGARDLAVAVALVAVASAGVAFGRLRAPAAAPSERPAEAALVARATFCPPLVQSEGARTEIALASVANATVPLRIEPGPRAAELPAGRLLVRPPADATGLSVTGFGSRLQAGARVALQSARDGSGAAPCSEVASDRWYFAEGSSELGADQRVLLHNPFLDEAVLRVIFHTPAGPIAKAALADVSVPSGRSIELAVNDFVLRERLLATSVLVTRGRVVAWRVQLPADDTSGMQMSLGAPAAAPQWYFPYGQLGPDAEESIALLNPGVEEAVVSITLATADSVEQPRGLLELTVPPESARRVDLSELTREPRRNTTVSAWVTAANGVPFVAERVVTLTGAQRAVSSEVGATESTTRWLLPPPAGRSHADVVEVMNPGSRDAAVDITLLRERGDPLSPRALAGIDVRAGLRRSVDVSRWAGEDLVAAVVHADRPIVAERWGRPGRRADLAASLGVPVRPSEPR